MQGLTAWYTAAASNNTKWKYLPEIQLSSSADRHVIRNFWHDKIRFLGQRERSGVPTGGDALEIEIR